MAGILVFGSQHHPILCAEAGTVEAMAVGRLLFDLQSRGQFTKSHAFPEKPTSQTHVPLPSHVP